MGEYFVRADGLVTATNKALAVSSDSPETSLSMAAFNATGFGAGDTVYFSDKGGDYSLYFRPTIGGDAGDHTIYTNVPGEVPTIASPDYNSGIYDIAHSNIDINGFDIKPTAANTTSHVGVRLYNACDNLLISDISVDVSLCTGSSRGCMIAGQGVSNITLDGFYGKGANTPAVYVYGVVSSNLVFTSVTLEDNLHDAFSLALVDNISGDNIKVLNTARRAFFLSDCTGLLNLSNVQVVASGPTYSAFVLTGCSFAEGSKLSNVLINSATNTSALSLVGVNNLELEKVNTGSACHSGFVDTNSTNILYDRCYAISTTGMGYFVTGTGHDLEYINCLAENNLSDGFCCSGGAINILYHGNTAKGNGEVTDPTSSAGDGFTSHDTNTGLKYLFNLAQDNMFSGFALTQESSGVIHHNTTVGNNKGNTPQRGEMYLSASAGIGWDIKNNILMNLDSYPIYWTSTYATTVIDADYNVYISNELTPFLINEVAKTWAEWIAALPVGNETNSIFVHFNGTDYDVYKGSVPSVINQTLTYCPVDTNGKPVNKSDNPILTMNHWIPGVNQEGQAGIDGKKVYGGPIPGCYQGVGMPNRGSRQILQAGPTRGFFW